MMLGFRARMFVGFLFVAALIFGVGYYAYHARAAGKDAAAATYKTPEESNADVRFVLESYDVVQANYWKGAPDSDLSQLYVLSLEKALGGTSTTTLSSPDRAGVAKMLAAAFAGKDTSAANKLAVDTVTIALYNLAPVGRTQLLSTQAQTALNNIVTNVNPGANLYANLGAPKGATTDTVEKAYTQKKAELEATTSPSKKQDLAAATYAHQVLTNTTQKNLYDTTSIEPTVFVHRPNASTLYMYIEKMSPTTESEFENAIQAAAGDAALSSMILDLRGNVGGDLTFAQTFLGDFLGPNQYAFDIYAHGSYVAQRTLGLQKLPGLNRFREIAVVTDGMTQSTAEVITAALKRSHLASSVGATTRGWGSIEQIIPMHTTIDPAQTYAIEMVVDLTVRDDAQPIEGNGVVPDVSISDPRWESELSQHFFSPSLIAAVKTVPRAPPLK